MKGSFVELKNVFPELKCDVGENETQAALVDEFSNTWKVQMDFLFLRDDVLRDIISKCFENTEQWTALGVIGKGEKMEVWKDSNDLVKAKSSCDAPQ